MTESCKKEGLHVFAEYCEVFYTASTDLSPTLASTVEVNSSSSHTLHEAKYILSVLDNLLLNQKNEECGIDEGCKSAVERCGLSCMDSSSLGVDETSRTKLLSDYVKVKNEVRNKAHTIQSDARIQYLLKWLRDSGDKVHNDDNGEINDVLVLLKSFVGKYSSLIGSHSFLRGCKSILKSQLGNEYVNQWEFSVLVLTENVISSSSSSSGMPSSSSCFWKDGLSILFRIFHFESFDEINRSLTWVLKEDWTDTDIRNFLSVLPQNFETKAAGTCKQTTTPRNEGWDSSDTSDNFCFQCLRDILFSINKRNMK